MESNKPLSEAARALGRTRSKRKAASSRANLAKARAARHGARPVQSQPVEKPQQESSATPALFIRAGKVE